MKRLDEIKRGSIIIIGAGHFGRRAVDILDRTLKGDKSIIVVDRVRSKIEDIESQRVICVEYDGIGFLIDHLRLINPDNMIVPAIPEHLAVEWLMRYMKEKENIIYKKTEIPDELREVLPYTWNGSEGSLLVSYADFRCPDDCPEPEGYCTVTGEKRDIPLYSRFKGIKIDGFTNYTIRSRQLAPGLGGYRAEELFRLRDAVMDGEVDRWLIGTSCKCHGIITGIEKVRALQK